MKLYKDGKGYTAVSQSWGVDAWAKTKAEAIRKVYALIAEERKSAERDCKEEEKLFRD